MDMEFEHHLENHIIGTGVDILEVNRMVRDLADLPDFASEFCSDEEITYCDSTHGFKRAERYTTHFCAKEAVIKALGGGGETEFNWREIIVKRKESGQPYIELIGQAKLRAEELRVAGLPISIAHDRNTVIAYCIAIGYRLLTSVEASDILQTFVWQMK